MRDREKKLRTCTTVKEEPLQRVWYVARKKNQLEIKDSEVSVGKTAREKKIATGNKSVM